MDAGSTPRYGPDQVAEARATVGLMAAVHTLPAAVSRCCLISLSGWPRLGWPALGGTGEVCSSRVAAVEVLPATVDTPEVGFADRTESL